MNGVTQFDKSSSAIYAENMFLVACLDVGQGHEVLGDVNNKLVHESRSNVITILHVVEVVPKLCSTYDGKFETKTEGNTKQTV